MLYNELETAWKESAAEFNGAMEAEAQRKGWSRAIGTVPAELKPWEYEYLMALYARDEFDAICVGPHRHQRFAMWAVKNYGDWQRVIEREFSAMYDRLRVAAGTTKLSNVEVR